MSFRLSDPLNRQGEYAIITGGNRGIGFYTLLGLQASGMKVIAGKLINSQNGRQLFKHR